MQGDLTQRPTRMFPSFGGIRRYLAHCAVFFFFFMAPPAIYSVIPYAVRVRGRTAHDEAIKMFSCGRLRRRFCLAFGLWRACLVGCFASREENSPSSHWWLYPSLPNVESVHTFFFFFSQIPMAVAIQPMAVVGPEEIPVALVDFGERSSVAIHVCVKTAVVCVVV